MAERTDKLQSVDVFDSSFFVLRTPALPVSELAVWSGSQDDEGATDWSARVGRLRAYLRRIIDRPEIMHALFIASPSLQSGLEYWRKDPESKKGLQAERAVTRYFARMCGRSTPFGLFSGCSVGSVVDSDENVPSELSLEGMPQYRLNTRLDFDYLFALTRSLRRDPTIAAHLRYWPNSSLRRMAETWHYVESRITGSSRSHHLVKVEDDEYLSAVLDRACSGATQSEMSASILLLSADFEITEQEAYAYVKELIDCDLLVSRLAPLVTGRSPLDDLIDQISGIPGAENVVRSLELAREQMATVDRLGYGSRPERYHAIASGLASLPAKPDLDKLFQVDLLKPARSAVLTRPVINELRRGIELLCRMGRVGEVEGLRSFRDAFSARFDRARIPLLTALDEENGVPFGSTGSESSPLIRGLQLAGGDGATGPSHQGLQALLQQQFAARQPGSSVELELKVDDLPSADSLLRSLPDSFQVNATLVAECSEALRDGVFQVYLKGLVGPDGARMLGRFCHIDGTLDQLVREHLAGEATHRPDVVFAEIVYLPEGRVGNVLCRPVLREYEIVYLGRSGAPEDRQLPASDLLISVEGGRIILHSHRLGKEIIPRLTNAHGFANPTLASVYRLLCHLQHQDVSVPSFSWGQFDSLDFLPRLRVGRLVLSTARWRLGKKEIEEISKPEKSGRFSAVQELRERRGLPRWILFEESDHTLPVDLDNPLLVDAFVHVLKRGKSAIVREMFPALDRQCVTGPEGSFCHELHVPFLRRLRPATSESQKGVHASPNRVVTDTTDRELRLRPPGSDWLYIKVYGGEGALDDVLRVSLWAILKSAPTSCAVSRWFFVRYSDPHPHLRIRFNGDPQRLMDELLPVLSGTFNGFLRSGTIWKVQFDTYEREIERYGGPEGLSAAEGIFGADSDAVITILQSLEGDQGLNERWHIALLGIDALLSDCGMELELKRTLLEKLRDAHFREFNVGVFGKKQLGDRFRKERKKLEALFDISQPASEAISAARKAFAQRSAALSPVFLHLRRLESETKLTQSLNDIALSYVHMHVNRLIRSSARAHETVLYDFLFRLYDGQCARSKHGPNALRGRSEKPPHRDQR
jgi:thiopeptide-type bacteriocin biosynthesis protein